MRGMHRRAGHLEIIVLIMALIAGCSRAVPAGTPTVKPYAGVNRPFSYSITDSKISANGQRRLLDDEGEKNDSHENDDSDEPTGTFPTDQLCVDGDIVDFVKDQLVVEFYDESKLDALLNKLNGKVVKHESIPVGSYVTGSKEDNTAQQTDTGERKLLPYYVLSFKYSPTDPLNDLVDNANAAGVSGNYQFSGARSAVLFNKLLEIKNSAANYGVASVSLNAVDNPSIIFNPGPSPGTNYQTHEGDNELVLNAGKFVAPDDPVFWFTAPQGYDSTYGGGASNFYYGSDLITKYDNVWNHADGNGINVAVIDDGFKGVRERYIDAAAIKRVELCINTSSNPTFAGPASTGDPWHGREVSSLIFAPHDDSAGTVGVAPEANPILIRADLSIASRITALETAIQFNAKVVNISFGAVAATPDIISGWDRVLQKANCKGMVVVAAAGNLIPGKLNRDSLVYPAGSPYCIGVGSHDKHGAISTFSNVRSAKIFAPGEELAVAQMPLYELNQIPQSEPPINRSYSTVHVPPLGGTSLSAPIVAGAVALGMQAGIINSFESAKSALFSSVAYSSNVTPELDVLSLLLGRSYSAPSICSGYLPASIPPFVPGVSPPYTGSYSNTPISNVNVSDFSFAGLSTDKVNSTSGAPGGGPDAAFSLKFSLTGSARVLSMKLDADNELEASTWISGNLGSSDVPSGRTVGYLGVASQSGLILNPSRADFGTNVLRSDPTRQATAYTVNLYAQPRSSLSFKSGTVVNLVLYLSNGTTTSKKIILPYVPPVSYVTPGNFKWIGIDNDVVSAGAIGPDGAQDGHFTLKLTVTGSTDLKTIFLRNENTTYVWGADSSTDFIPGIGRVQSLFILGIRMNGQPYNSGWTHDLGTLGPGIYNLDLYLHNYRGNSFISSSPFGGVWTAWIATANDGVTLQSKHLSARIP